MQGSLDYDFIGSRRESCDFAVVLAHVGDRALDSALEVGKSFLVGFDELECCHWVSLFGYIYYIVGMLNNCQHSNEPD